MEQVISSRLPFGASSKRFIEYFLRMLAGTLLIPTDIRAHRSQCQSASTS